MNQTAHPANTAPHVTPEDVKAAIKGVSFTVLPDGRTTICQLTLDNGFTVTGHSACVSAAAFDRGVGEYWARKQAEGSAMTYLAFRLADRLNLQTEHHLDDSAVLGLSAEQRRKLEVCRANGKFGWGDCPAQHLSNLLHKAVDSGRTVDVANYCAFLHARGEAILPRAPVQVDRNADFVVCCGLFGDAYGTDWEYQPA